MSVKTSAEWSEIYGVRVLDPDGWRSTTAMSWDYPIGVIEWEMRLGRSTIKIVDHEKYRKAWVDHSY